MSRVKLIVKNYRSLDSGSVVDTELKVPDTQQILGVIRTEFDSDSDGTTRASDDIVPLIPYERINDLVGKLLTMIDASVVDAEQRKAMKDIYRQIAWDWYDNQQQLLDYPWRKDKGLDA